MEQGALSGIKVLDLSRVLAGPSCTQILADLGADVVKIERPAVGDETRAWAPPSFPDGVSAYFSTVNRNKKSLTVDISKPQGQEIIRRLAVDADVLIENYKVGGLKKYGLDYDSLKEINPRLIYASLTGFGQSGPDANKPGYDYIIQGMAGLMSITGPADGMPHKVGVAVVDLFAGLQSVIGIQAAIIERERSNQGQYIDVALLDSAISMLANVGSNYLASGKMPPRLGNTHPNIVPYQVFETKGNQHFILACGNDAQFSAICQLLGLSELTQDARFSSNPQRVHNREALTEILSECFLQKGRDEWLVLLESVKVPCGSINDVVEAFEMPQVAFREMQVKLTEGTRSMNLIGNPIKLSRTPVRYHSLPPLLGQHSDEVLTGLGLSAAEIQKLKEEEII